MNTRTLKTGVSAVGALACLLLVVLWVRSHWIADRVSWNGWGRVAVTSMKGQIRVSTSRKAFVGGPLLQWKMAAMGSMMPDNLRNWSFRFYPDGTFATVPHRLPIALFAFFAVAPWLRWRYSLRTLLIAITVVSLVLGLFLFLGR
jgi:hypothetical protein